MSQVMIAVGGACGQSLVIADRLCMPLVHEVAHAFLIHGDDYRPTILQVHLQEILGRHRFRTYAVRNVSPRECSLTFSVKQHPEVLIRRGSVDSIVDGDRGILTVTLLQLEVSPVKRTWVAGTTADRPRMITDGHISVPVALNTHTVAPATQNQKAKS